MATTPFGSITDVAGVRVGHHQRSGRGWQTGTTVVFVPDGATPGVSVRGGGPGTRETDALRPENLVRTIHAVCLTGGSAFGLAAADGVVGWLEEQGSGSRSVPADRRLVGVVPVVPAAVIFDLGRGGDFENRPDAGFGRRAVARARRTQRSWGSVGAGTGARAGGLQGGVGTAGTIVTIAGDIIGTPGIDAQVSVGAIAVVNANGSPIDPSSGLPWTTLRSGTGLDLRRPSAGDRRSAAGRPRRARRPSPASTPPSASSPPRRRSPSRRSPRWPTSPTTASRGRSVRRTRCSTETRSSVSRPATSTSAVNPRRCARPRRASAPSTSC